MIYGRGSTPGSFPRSPAMPVPTSTTPSHVAMRRSNPRSNRSNVNGPGAMKNTQIQIGQCATRYVILLRSRMGRSLASSIRRAWPSGWSYDGGSNGLVRRRPPGRSGTAVVNDALPPETVSRAIRPGERPGALAHAADRDRYVDRDRGDGGARLDQDRRLDRAEVDVQRQQHLHQNRGRHADPDS